MLRVEKINKNFGEKKVLREVSFEMKENSVVGLLGPNGAGKTTLMRVVVGFLKANSGKLWWGGKEIDPKSMDYRSRIGYLPENNPLYSGMTAEEYLRLVAELKGVEKGNIGRAIKKTAEDCGLVKVGGQKIETLSKGYRQRVGLAAALLGNPELLVLDEPTSGLDPNQIIEIRELIQELAKKKMVLFSTHILPEARAVCQRLLIINQGKIVLDEETRKVKNLEKKFVELTI